MFDIIGDIHGHANKLKALLSKLGYSLKNGIYSHPERKVLFIGDYIDRGPEIRETLTIIRSMTEAGNAIALMGNHEYNAICFHYQKSSGGHLRKHKIKNIIQHYATLSQFQNMQKEYEDYIDWFKTLPLFYETENFRAVHACWDKSQIDYLRKVLHDNKLTDDLIYKSANENTELFTAIDISLKGKEIKLPAGHEFKDNDGAGRKEIRIKWWENPVGSTYYKLSIHPFDIDPEFHIDISLLKNIDYYKEFEKPVFFGHYWLEGEPKLFIDNICCLDFSVAKNGYLAAYRFDSENILGNDKLVYV